MPQSLKQVTDWLIEKGEHFTTLETSLESGFSNTLSETIKRNKPNLLLILGGDGTFCDIINALSDFSIEIGVIQCGTGNDFSKAISYPKNLEGQLERIFNSAAKAIDLWTCNERRFANGVGLGFDGSVAHKVTALRKKGARGKLVYWKTILATIFTYKHHSFEIVLNNESFSLDAFLITVANGRSFGGGFQLTPKALVDDELLDVCIIRKVSVFQRLLRLPFIPFGKHTGMSVVRYEQVKTAGISSSSSIEAHIDGEPFVEQSFQFSLFDQKLLLRY